MGDEPIDVEFQRWLNPPKDRSGRAAAGTTPLEVSADDDATKGAVGPGEMAPPVRVDPDSAAKLVLVAARMAAGFFRPTRSTSVVWVEGDSELAVDVGAVRLALDLGRVDLTLPVRCDQTGPAEVVVTFAVGRPDRPAGVYAATARRPTGPQLIVDAWGDALVAFAWDVLLTLAAQLAGARGKDARGNLLVPADMAVTREALVIAPMGRFRFAGESGLGGTP